MSAQYSALKAGAQPNRLTKWFPTVTEAEEYGHARANSSHKNHQLVSRRKPGAEIYRTHKWLLAVKR